jgi:outer membrane protein OmpA-like peptidoglycan-associated protein
MASLKEIGKVNEESRGMVITLSGSVLFATGKSDLLPIAKEKLNDVAKALKDQGFKEIIVEGHTDSRGSAQANQELSLKRAESVRTHLVGQGIPSDKIRATGLGSDRPVADNKSEEGRANNRRVEIVVTPFK